MIVNPMRLDNPPCAFIFLHPGQFEEGKELSIGIMERWSDGFQFPILQCSNNRSLLEEEI
jgi:hypothetical protein